MLIALMLASAVPAAHASLSCTVNEGGGERIVYLKVNPHDQRASLFREGTGRRYVRRMIAASTVFVILDDEATWTIDRTNLEYRREIGTGKQRRVDSGKCMRIARIPQLPSAASGAALPRT